MVVLFCVVIIIYKFIRYFDNKKKEIIYQENNRRDIKILEAKLRKIKLKNRGRDLDENIRFISNDESIVFSMEWGDVIEPNENL